MTALLQSVPVLAVVFVLAAGAVWLAGSRLSAATDVLADRYHLGEALGGAILLAFATNLPEIAITAIAALGGHLDLAIGNLLGGIGLQTVVLVALDVAEPAPLTSRTLSLRPLLGAGLVIGVLAVAVMGTALPPAIMLARLTPEDLAVAAVWVAGLLIIKRAGKGLPWKLSDPPPKARAKNSRRATSLASRHPLAVFAVGALVTLVAGATLAQTGDALSHAFGVSGVVFGATVLAAVTSLPELSTGLAAVRAGDHELAMSDIFGGNAFLPVLFLMATLLSGKAALPQAGKTNVYLAVFGILVTMPYFAGLLFRPQRQLARLGIDSAAVLILYVLGIVGLVLVAH